MNTILNLNIILNMNTILNHNTILNTILNLGKQSLLGFVNTNLILQAKVGMKSNETWFIDSGCSEHMTGNIENFTSLQKHHGGKITFGDNSKGRIVGKGKVKLSNSIHVGDVNLVETLGFNLLSVAMLCDQGKNKVMFDEGLCLVKHKPTKKIIMRGKRHNNSYIFDKDFVPDAPLCPGPSNDFLVPCSKLSIIII